MLDSKCKICRRSGTKLFLKGDKCFSAKCALTRRPYGPGMKTKKRKKAPSEYGKELGEKQKVKGWYNLRERQFKKYVKEILEKRGKVENTSSLLVQKLEMRLDNTVFRLGFASSRSAAKQMVTHGHLYINGKLTDVPSRQMKKGDKISIKPFSKDKAIFKNLAATLKKYQVPSWLELDKDKLEGKVIGLPTPEETALPAEISAIFEYYSR
ncbi:MAG: 30S ribosomal protein S4 [Candidatus Parcubacteria bacterium]|nr:30S ribosomal protein S4 [Candidatus Parcubacteria bacterium]